ncbi:nitronate monooxygenase [Gemmatimonas phototrophica]|uniref:2-nitropropane dioxygenase n=1 Tax=Gemmatimonas phototrophica TaxID=1379270 RepID=A0A143BLN8_9BACT|nr:nitronate monooxygenase [Gemmatimonas phototrophica]AMW05957.1 2-nitropropane dioxygenase [Gemmatimonas phototrophica]
MVTTETTSPPTLPQIIQGGMGIGVSNWRLANAVSRLGQLGVVSGTVIDTVLVRRLQDGDPGGHMRRALAHFPIPGIADELLRRYFLPEGRAPGAPYHLLPMYKQVVSSARQRVTVAAGFVETWLAREGHENDVGMNLLTKVQMPNLPTLYGAMLAGVATVIMGAGIPREIPGALDALASHRKATLRFDVEGLARDDAEWLTFDPAEIWPEGTLPATPLRRPHFYPVVSAVSLAATLARKSNGRVDGFVVEGPTAGGHNAPPRGAMQLDALGQPIYGERDAVDLVKLAELGLPFWVAGGVGTPDGLCAARAAGAAGIQVGTLFAFCDESGLAPDIKQETLRGVLSGTVEVRTDPRASPTGYPFKVVQLPGHEQDAAERERICDLGYLREAVKRDDGRMIYRCAAEPVNTYMQKGGTFCDTDGRRCLCNGLLADVGLAQERDGHVEPPLVTSGDDLASLAHFASPEGYTAGEVLEWLLHGTLVATA